MFNFPKFNRLTPDEVDYFGLCVTQVSFISPILSDLYREKLSLSMMVVDWHSACEEYQKKKKKKLKDRNETKRCDWNVRQDERCCKTKRSLGNGQGKKTIACCSFQRAPSAAATRKTVHVSKIKATTTTAKKTENKSNQQRREDEWTNGGEFERVRRVWDCVTMKEKKDGKGYTRSMSNK